MIRKRKTVKPDFLVRMQARKGEIARRRQVEEEIALMRFLASVPSSVKPRSFVQRIRDAIHSDMDCH